MTTVPDCVLASSNDEGIPDLDLSRQGDVLDYPRQWGSVARSTDMVGRTISFYVDDGRFNGLGCAVEHGSAFWKLWERPAKVWQSGAPSFIEVNFSTSNAQPYAVALHQIYKKRHLSRLFQDLGGMRCWVDMNVAERWEDINLTGSLPSVPFRVAVTLSSVTGHTDVAGTVTVGSEVITFTAATRKTTTTLLSALPTITTANLNCNILVEAITSAGAPILAESLTAIAVRLAAKTSGFYNSAGVWTKTDYLIHCKTAMDVGDIVRYGSTDYVIMARKEAVDLDGTVQFYKYQSSEMT